MIELTISFYKTKEFLKEILGKRESRKLKICAFLSGNELTIYAKKVNSSEEKNSLQNILNTLSNR